MCIHIDIARGGFCSFELNRNAILTRLSLTSSGDMMWCTYHTQMGYVRNVCMYISQDIILYA